jgi:transmembrane sensor
MEAKTRQLESLHAQQASAWLETLRRPKSGDEARFVSWLKESPRNVRDFLIMLALDHALGEIDAGRSMAIDALLAQADAHITPLPLRADVGATGAGGPQRQSSTALISPARSRRRRQFAALAAGVLLAAVGGWAWIAHARSAWTQFETATGEQRTFELPDGSVVYLNTHSHLAIRFAAHTRDVRLLSGEALFQVHHDTSRPFRVYTDDAMVQAVGTQFDVYRREDGTVVSVIEGRVNVTPASPPGASERTPGSAPQGSGPALPVKAPSRTLGASQEARVSHAGSVSIREVNNVTDTVAWRERRLIFNDQTLGQIVGEFNRYRANPIRLDGAGVSERIYTGVFDADDADSLVEVLARDPALAVDRSPEGIVVRMR